MTTHHTILIAGGGTAGISVAAQLTKHDPNLDIAVIEPSEWHYYQPIWTLVGGGVLPKEESRQRTSDFIPGQTTWIRDSVASFSPEKNQVKLASGKSISYDHLIVALGIQLHWDSIEGLEGNVGKNGICSNYDYNTVDSTWRELENFKGGNAVFTIPPMPIKCAGAPQKIMWLADSWLRKRGVRDQSNVIYAAAGESIFGVPKYRHALEKLVEERDIDTRFQRVLTAVRPEKREAVFKNMAANQEEVVSYELLHVVPEQGPPEVVKSSTLADDAGWVEVDRDTLQHTRFPNVFSLGDNSSLPTSRTGAAIRKQVPVLVENLLALRANEKMTASYDGYTSCPLVTGYGEMMLAEFDYDGNPAETFPVDQARPRYSMWLFKRWGLPELYWNGMLRGHM